MRVASIVGGSLDFMYRSSVVLGDDGGFEILVTS